MANILLRSPYYEYETEAGALSAKLELSIGGTLRYTLVKDTDSSDGALFEISELARDYIDIEYSGSYSNQVLTITGSITFYDEVNAGGSSVGTPYSISHKGFDGYGEFEDGASPTVLNNSLGQSNNVIYFLENTAGTIPSISAGVIVYNPFTAGATSAVIEGVSIQIKRICEPKFTPIKVTFVNKFGALQDLWFFKKSIESLAVEKEKYKRSIVTSTGTYDTSKHASTILNTKGSEKITMNTGFMDEGMNEPIKEMLLSEQVWTTIGGDVKPVILDTESLTYKTSVNDRLVDYTINFSYAYDTINNIR